MKKMRRILALLLSCALLFGICGIAEDSTTGTEQAPVLELIEPAEEPAEELAEEPVEELAEEPVEELVDKPAEELVEEEPVEEEPAEAEPVEEPEADIPSEQFAYCEDDNHDIDYEHLVPINEYAHGYKCKNCDYYEYEGSHCAYCTDPTTCAACGATFTSYGDESIEHPNAYYTYKNNKYHIWTCPDCGETIEYEHDVLCSQSAPYICEECHQEVIDPELRHSYPDEMQSDDQYHWYICTECGQEFEKYEHRAWCDEPGVCAGCGEPYTGPNVEHEVDWEHWEHDDTMHWHVCLRCGEEAGDERYEHQGSCQNPDVCVDCGAHGTMAYVGHVFGGVAGSDENQHWYKCELCGYVEYGNHWTDCDDPSGLCVECGKPAVEIYHDIDDEHYEHDERSHWNICNACVKKVYPNMHMIRCVDADKERATCLECGAEVLTKYAFPSHNGDTVQPKNKQYHTVTCEWCGEKWKARHYVSCTSKTPKICEVCGQKGSPLKYHDYNYTRMISSEKECGLYCDKCKKYEWKQKHIVYCNSNGRCDNCGREVPNATVEHNYVDSICIYCDSEAHVECVKTLTLTAKDSFTLKPSSPIDTKFTYESKNKTVATVNSKGKITANGVGEAEIVITGKSSTLTASCIVTVKPNPTSLSLDKGKSGTVNIGENLLQLVATVQPSDALQNVTWKASNGKVSVANGIITPLKPGKVTITATTEAKKKNGKKISAKFDLTVVEPKLPTKVTIDQTSPQTIYLGGEGIKLTAVVEPQLTASQEVTWSIPAKQQKYATIDAKTGVVTPSKKSGTVTVTVATKDKKVNGKKAKATITIKVEPAQ